MSSSKRQKIEEYHDPDYCQDASQIETPESDSMRRDKIKMIIKREFLKEISSKEEEINVIDHKLNQTKRLLQRVRYAVAMSYYTKKNLVHSANELKCDNNVNDTVMSTVGQAIHPSLKKLLGKKPIDYEEILKSRSPRNAAKTARSTLIKPKKKGSTKPDKDVAINEMKIPRYVSPIKPDIKIEKINSSRGGRNQTSHLIVVGNTSKYIGDEKSANEVTHKWLVYIKTKTSVGIEEMVSKVRFFLHPSYKPNDVIEVDSPPFQISRRGWGEFPIRVQLYFHERVNQKPLQIYHNLVLDKKMTGLQTMGAETVVEIWLDLPIPNGSGESRQQNVIPKDEVVTKNETLAATITSDVSEESFKINEPSIPSTSETLPKNQETSTRLTYPKSDTQLKTSPENLNEISEIFKDSVAKSPAPVKMEKVNVKTAPTLPKKTLVRCLDSNGKIVFVQLQVDPNNPKNIKIIKTPTVIASTQPSPGNVAKPAMTQSNLTTSSEQKRLTSPATNILSNASNSPKQNTKVNPIVSTSTTTNLKPIMVSSNANLTRLNPADAKRLLENRKIVFIKSPTAPNSTNPPPLVRLSSPVSVGLAPSTTNVKIIQPKSAETRKVIINANNVIMKNGKIIIVDKHKPNSKPKQESLLKPQVSLLKPLLQKQINDATSTKSVLIQPPSSQIQRCGNRKQTSSLVQNVARRDYYKEFCAIFLRHRFETVRSAIEYILKNTPLVNITLSSRPEFNAAFPFITESQDKFDGFPLPKKRLNEWYRAKFVLRLIQQHPDLKNQTLWMTREVIIFGRRFGYTPAHNDNALIKQQLSSNENSFKDMIKRHIKEEQLKNVTITYNNKVKDFLHKFEDLTKTSTVTTPGSVDVVDVVGDNNVTPVIHEEVKSKEMRSDNVVLDVNKIMHTGGTLVQDICNDIRIKLEKEEIVDGVLCSSSQLMLWQAMRSFMEDLIRRSFATKPLPEQISDLSAERCVRQDDIRKAILTTENFSFLTNKHLGKRSS